MQVPLNRQVFWNRQKARQVLGLGSRAKWLQQSGCAQGHDGASHGQRQMVSTKRERDGSVAPGVPYAAARGSTL